MLSHYRNVEILRVCRMYKHVRFKFSSESSKEKTMSLAESLKIRSEVLCEILNCSIYTAREIIKKDKNIVRLQHHHFYQNAKFCKKFLKLSDLIEFPCLLTLDPSLLQHRYFSLKELGFCNITPSYIFRFSHILKETPKTLKQKGFPFGCQYKPEILMEYLDTSRRTEINYKLQQMYENGSNLQKIKEAMNAEFLSSKLECSIGRAHQMLHNCAALRVQSISNTDHLINVLLSKLGFSISKICRVRNLLTAHHEIIEHLLSEIPEILGVDIVFIARRIPLILKQQSDPIRKMENILKNFNVTKDQLMCCPKVLSISPNTLEKRLTAICSIEDFAVLLSNKKFLWLVYYFKNLNTRLKCLKAENMPCSINMFTVTKSTFEKYLVYTNTRTCVRETYVYLADIFKMSEKEIFTRLRHYVSNRSDVQDFSALNSRKVVEFLLLSGITKEQIFKGLEIVFYEIDVVKAYFKNLKDHHACQPFEDWVSHCNLIQLLIYTIEVVEYHSYKIDCDEPDVFVECSTFRSMY